MDACPINNELKSKPMKKILLVCSFLFFTASLLTAQTEIKLRIDHRLDGKAFALNQEAGSPSGTKYKLTRLQYYLSGFKITHDGGQTTVLDQLYFLVDPSKANSKELSIGSFSNITTIENIEFAVGVDYASNHLDPAAYPASHPLAPKNPSMHWGWTSGYRFIALEGKAGRVNGQFIDDIGIHTVGNSNYKINSYTITGKMENGILYLDMIAEYNLLLEGISIAGGANNHGESGSASTLCINASTKVFSPATPSATGDIFNNAFSKVIYNADQIFIKYALPSSESYEFNLFDSRGTLINKMKLSDKEGLIPVQNQLSQGAYYYLISTMKNPVTSGKILKQ